MSRIAKRTYRITGISPLIMHAVARLIDPTDEGTAEMKSLSAKRKKTEDDYARMSELEFFLGIYADDKGRPVLPADNLQAMIVEAARKSRLGKQFLAGVFVSDDAPLIYDGPKTVEGLWKDGRFVDRRSVVVQRNRVVRTRPIFREWAADVVFEYHPSVVNASQLDEAIGTAGSMVGFGDFRPRFGRFVAELVEAKAVAA